MIVFISFLKFLSTILITNAHYAGIYPTDWLAHGGMLGNVLFFAISGFCLYNVRNNFAVWYSKRFVRVYFPTAVIVTVYLLLGAFKVTEQTTVAYYYIQYYHFVLSIIILYIPYYVVMSVKRLKSNLLTVIIAVAIAYFIVYIFFIDKTKYTVDYITEPFVRFVFFEAMLIGAYFRQNDSKYRNKNIILPLIGTAVMLVVYFASKLAVTRYAPILNFQFVVQLTLLILMSFIFRTFACLDSRFEKVPAIIKRLVNFISGITLEIYVVQHMIIEYFQPQRGMSFPLNLIVVTLVILAAAIVLHYACYYPLKLFNKVIDSLNNKALLKKNTVTK